MCTNMKALIEECVLIQSVLWSLVPNLRFRLGM